MDSIKYKDFTYAPYYPLQNLILDIDPSDVPDPLIISDVIFSPITIVAYGNRNDIWAALQLILESEFSDQFQFNVEYVRWAVGLGYVSYLELNGVRLQDLIDAFDKTVEFQKPCEIHNRFIRLLDILRLEVILPEGNDYDG